MTHRFLVYPLLLLAWMQLLPLLRRDWRWHLATILQLAAVLVFGGVALLSRDGARWVALSWGTFVLLHITPRLLLAGSARYRQQGRWRRAAPLEDLAGWLMLGEMGRLRRRYATALRAMAGGASELAVEMLRDAESPTMPTAARGLVRAWRLAFLLHRREWMAAVVLFQDTPEWGSAAVTIFVRLQIARAFAELDDLPRAMRCLQFVMLAPSVMSLEEPLWAMRIRLAAMAGDTTEVDRLLGDRRRQRRGFARFAAYWRGRAALAKGDKTTALGQLSRAYAITDPRDLAWQQAIGHYLKLVESPIYVPPAVSPEYQQELAGLRLAEEQSRPWRDLIGLRRPTPVVAILLAEIS